LVTVTFRVEAVVFAFPAASVNEPDATVITAVPPTDGDAVNTAVYVVPLPEMALRVPSVVLTSPVAKDVVASVEVNVIVAVPPEAIVITNGVICIVGTTPSTINALFWAILLAPLGTVVEVIVLPAVSRIVPIVKLETVKSEDDCPDATVYVPVKVVPAEAAIKGTVAPELSVTVIVFPDWIDSLVVAEMLIVPPMANVPLAVDEENAVTVGKIVSTVIDSAVEDALVTPVCVWVAVIDQIPSLNVPNVQDPDESAHVTLLEPDFTAVTVPAAPADNPETVIVGVASEVKLSVELTPRSLAVSRSG
jgi:hypothetical protein